MMRKDRLVFGLYAGLVVVFAGLFFIDDVSHGTRGRLIVALLGPTGALWLFRAFLLLSIGALILGIRSEIAQRKRIDQIARQRESLDRSLRDPIDPTA